MKRLTGVFSKAILALAIASSFVGCTKKSNTINNGQVLQTPYFLYFTDTSGALYNSSDGKTTKVIFPSDGYPTRAIITDGENIIMAKPSMYVSTNNGTNFNYSYVNSDVATVNYTDVNGKNIDLNQSMLINIPSWAHSYVASRHPGTFFGIAWNADGGKLNKWFDEDYYDTLQVTWPHATVTSFTYLKSGVLVAMDATWTGSYQQRVFSRAGLQARWIDAFSSGLPAPPATAGANNGAWLSLGHLNDQLIAIDAIGNSATTAFYSNDKGTTWAPFSGLPPFTPLLCICSPFEELCLVGTDKKGLYFMNTNTGVFQQVTNGLPPNLSVRGITYKQNIYKNETTQKFVYISTNQGIFQSTDLGMSWVKTIPGNYVNIY